MENIPSVIVGFGAGFLVVLGFALIAGARSRRFKLVGLTAAAIGAGLTMFSFAVLADGSGLAGVASFLVGGLVGLGVWLKRRQVVRRVRSALGGLGLTAPAKQNVDRSASRKPARGPDWAPAVTVVVTASSEGDLLRACVDSVRNNTEPSEMMIVVCGSHAQTMEAAERERQHPTEPTHTVRVPRTTSPAFMRNVGLWLCRTPLVQFIDADDLLVPDAIATRLAVLKSYESDASVAAAAGGSRPVEASYRMDPDDNSPPRDILPQGVDIVDLVRGATLQPFHPVLGCLWRREALLRIGGFPEETDAEDLHMLLSALQSGAAIASINRVDSFYRQRQISRHTTTPISISGRLRDYTDAFYGPEVVELRRNIAHLNRLIPYVAYATATSGEISRAALDELPSVPNPWLARHVDITGLVSRGFQRARLSGVILVKPEIEADLVNYIQRSVTSAETDPKESRIVLGLATSERDRSLLVEVADETTYLSPIFGGYGNGAAASPLPALMSGRVSHLAAVDPPPPVIAHIAESFGVPLVVVDAPWSNDVVAADAPRVSSAGNIQLDDEIVPGRRPSTIQLPELPSLPGMHRDVWRADWVAGSVYEPHVDGHAYLSDLHDAHAGETCIIVGNGPSLNAVDTKMLATVPTFAVNGIFYLTDSTGFMPSFFVVEDTAFFEDNIDRIASYDAEQKFLPGMYRDRLQQRSPRGKVRYFNLDGGFYGDRGSFEGWPRFSRDAAEVVYAGQSVTTVNFQLAFYMGFTRVVLVGMDFSYSRPQNTVVDGHLWTSQGDDPNHFDPRYFGAGKTWKDPRLDRVLSNYRAAHVAFREAGREIINATDGGALEEFSRMSLEDALG